MRSGIVHLDPRLLSSMADSSEPVELIIFSDYV
jgi:hypothetical protein